MWLQDESCKSVVREEWGKMDCGGNPDLFMEKIKRCGNNLKEWERKYFGHIERKIQEIESELNSPMGSFVTACSVEQRQNSENVLEDLYKKQEVMWHQHARTNWIREGDKNTAFFHKTASGRRERNNIEKIMDSHGNWVDDLDQIERIFMNYFKDLFSAEPTLDMTRAIDAVETKVTEEMNDTLARPYTKDEVVEALTHIHPTKAPGPDGMPAIFYQKFWNVIKSEVISTVLDILNNQKNPASLNQTYIVLIPKKKKHAVVTDFRPISLCNVIFKLITKTIANRLKSILPNIIDHSQSAFVPGRLITDNALLAFEIFHKMKHSHAKKRGSFAFKLDMSKVYDRVEWPFLRFVMLKLGLCNNFVELIMRCISSVSFSILINGQPGQPFHPSRGLRQGDPLSPYLFLFCAEAFSSLIRKSEKGGNLHGISICRQAPKVSHLFFADDSIIFGRANEQEITNTFNIIRYYERASGQKINLEKSEISFSRGVGEDDQKRLATKMGVQLVAKHAIYLGIPTVVGRSKKELFQALVDRVRKKLKNWKGRFLSNAGKAILIKAVAQAILSYLMSCFLIPQEVCAQLNSVVSNFWWGQKKEERKIHWVSWSNMCKSKQDGGLGFRELQCFNEAMLAKQGWRLLHDNGSPLSRILKARYYPNNSFLTASVGYNPSYTWRSIVAGRKILDGGLCWTIGNGDSVNVWKDPWIHDLPHFRVLSPNLGWDENLRVRDLFNMDSSGWNAELVKEIFNPYEARTILAIPLSSNMRPDRLIWNHTKDCIYRVKSGYTTALAIKEYNSNSSSSSGANKKFWRWIWNLKVPPKIQLFMWRCGRGIIPTKFDLAKKGMDLDACCGRCGENIETIEHALRDCPWVKFFWAAGPLRLRTDESQGTIFDWLVWIMEHVDEDSHNIFACLLWVVWYARNIKNYQNKELEHQWCFNFAIRRLEEHRTSIEGIPDTKQPLRSATWRKPEIDWIKINTDASIRQGSGTGIGVALRDHDGKIVSTLTRFYTAEMEVNVAEAIACKEGLTYAKTLGLRKIELKMDNITVYKKIKESAPDLSYMGTVIGDIKDLFLYFDSVYISCVRRIGNGVAHLLAQYAFSFSDLDPMIGIMPEHIYNVANLEASY